MEAALQRTLARMKVEPVCPFCGQKMVFRHSLLTPAPLTDTVVWKCLGCFWLTAFCVPIDRETYEVEWASRCGQPHLSPYWEKGIEPDVNTEQLQALGYFECDYVEALKRRNEQCQR